MRNQRPPDLRRDTMVAALVGTLSLIVICPFLGMLAALGV